MAQGRLLVTAAELVRPTGDELARAADRFQSARELREALLELPELG